MFTVLSQGCADPALTNTGTPCTGGVVRPIKAFGIPNLPTGAIFPCPLTANQAMAELSPAAQASNLIQAYKQAIGRTVTPPKSPNPDGLAAVLQEVAEIVCPADWNHPPMIEGEQSEGVRLELMDKWGNWRRSQWARATLLAIAAELSPSSFMDTALSKIAHDAAVATARLHVDMIKSILNKALGTDGWTMADVPIHAELRKVREGVTEVFWLNRNLATIREQGELSQQEGEHLTVRRTTRYEIEHHVIDRPAP